jgi:hypothetical protein
MLHSERNHSRRLLFSVPSVTLLAIRHFSSHTQSNSTLTQTFCNTDTVLVRTQLRATAELSPFVPQRLFQGDSVARLLQNYLQKNCCSFSVVIIATRYEVDGCRTDVQGYVASRVVTAGLCGIMCDECRFMWLHVWWVQGYVASCEVIAGLCGFMCGDCRVMWPHVWWLQCYVASCVMTAG